MNTTTMQAPCAGSLRTSSSWPRVTSFRASSAAALCRSSEWMPARIGTKGGTCSSVIASCSSSGSAAGAQTLVCDPSLQRFVTQVKDRKFHCTQCGKCCTGEGEVWVTDEEAALISAHVEQPVDQFSIERTEQQSKHVGFRLLKNGKGPEVPCIFLVENQCSIHTVRPGQCSTYPWWPELMDKKRWEWEKKSVCEGFDHADANELDVTSAALQLKESTSQAEKILQSMEKKKRN